MTHLIAVLGLGAACIGWYFVQRWADALDPDPEDMDADCEECGVCRPFRSRPGHPH
jgi:hypothetical protein